MTVNYTSMNVFSFISHIYYGVSKSNILIVLSLRQTNYTKCASVCVNACITQHDLMIIVEYMRTTTTETTLNLLM